MMVIIIMIMIMICDDDDPNESECETKELAPLLMIPNQEAGQQEACLQPDKRPPANRREIKRSTKINYKIQNYTNAELQIEKGNN